MTCPRCGAELVEVDNPLRREVRHRRGTTCKRRPETPTDLLLRYAADPAMIVTRDEAGEIAERILQRHDPDRGETL